jgi:hypothetical protein
VSSRAAGIGFLGFAWRAVFALVLVLATYNPSQISYYHWLRGAVGAGSFGAVHAVVGIALLAGWVVFLRATFQSLGVLGLLLGAAFFAALVWLLVDLGWLATDSVPAMTWITLVCLSLLLAIGMSWSHVRRRMTGQVDVDDVEGGR